MNMTWTICPYSYSPGSESENNWISHSGLPPYLDSPVHSTMELDCRIYHPKRTSRLDIVPLAFHKPDFNGCLAWYNQGPSNDMMILDPNGEIVPRSKGPFSESTSTGESDNLCSPYFGYGLTSLVQPSDPRSNRSTSPLVNIDAGALSEPMDAFTVSSQWGCGESITDYGCAVPQALQYISGELCSETQNIIQQDVSTDSYAHGSPYLSDLKIHDDSQDAEGEDDSMAIDDQAASYSSSTQKTSKTVSSQKIKTGSCKIQIGSRKGPSKEIKKRNPVSRSGTCKYTSNRKSDQSTKRKKVSRSEEKSSASTTAPHRKYSCSFKMYGCDSTFKTKNEWKRHFSSQHLQLEFYRCDFKGCREKSKGPNMFNRKDLFTQHLRRMHAPAEGKEFDKTLDEHAKRCLQKVRKAPTETRCGNCQEQFTSYSERMEHMSKHYENEMHFEEKVDSELEAWAVSQKILCPKNDAPGRFVLAEPASKRRPG